MATNEKDSVIVELYDNTLTERKDDRYGRVVTTKSLTEDDIISIVVSRRTELSPDTLRAGLNIMKDVAAEQIANGASVAFGLGYFGLSVNGVFIGDGAKWDATKHSLNVRVTPTAELRSRVNAATVDVRNMAGTGIIINSATDVTTGEMNSKLTPGGAVNLTGNKIKIAGENAANGIELTNVTTQAVIKIAANAIAINDPSKMTFVVPADIPQGDYKLSITTQFSSSTQTLKDPRTCIFDYVLNVL